MKITNEFTKKFKKKLKDKGANFTNSEIKTIEDYFVETLIEEVSEGKTASLLNFGVFSSSLQTFKNETSIEKLNGKFERFVVRFKSATKLKQKINAFQK